MVVLNELDKIALYNDERDLIMLENDTVSYYGKKFDANAPFHTEVSGPSFFSIYTSITTKLSEEAFKKFSIRMNSENFTVRDAILMQEALSSVHRLYSELRRLNDEECLLLVSQIVVMNTDQLAETVETLHQQFKSIHKK